jgi:dihydrofolate reductase
MAKIKAIAAVSLNGVIGKKGDLPWRIPGELKWFKKITMGHIIVMGRKTWDSLPGLLPGRENWILSRSNHSIENAKVFTSFDEVENTAGDRTVFIIGGGEIYSAFLPKCEEIYLTEVPQIIQDGDAFFPSYKNDFHCTETLEKNDDFTIGKWCRNK